MKESQYFLNYNRKHVKRSRELRKNMTRAECKIWYEYLRHLPVRVLRQRPIDNFIVDFYCASRKIIIEIDGEIHSTIHAKEYDDFRTSVLEGYGLKVIRFTNNEVLNNFEYVCGILDRILL